MKAPAMTDVADLRWHLARDLERVILRRLYEKRIDGYTLETGEELADIVIAALSPPPAASAERREDIATILRDRLCVRLHAKRTDDEEYLDAADAILALLPSGAGEWRPLTDAPHDLGVPILIQQEGDKYPDMVCWLEPVGADKLSRGWWPWCGKFPPIAEGEEAGWLYTPCPTFPVREHAEAPDQPARPDRGEHDQS